MKMGLGVDGVNGSGVIGSGVDGGLVLVFDQLHSFGIAVWLLFYRSLTSYTLLAMEV